jgi:uncharacterized membrane protein (UPF0127 family)
MRRALWFQSAIDRLKHRSGPVSARTRGAIAWMLLCACLAGPVAAQEPPPGYEGNPPIEPLTQFPQAQLGIEAAQGRVNFRIWLADTPLRQQQGLMFVRELAADQGMLFVNDPPRASSFWMKNTYIPLDLLFIDTRGRIVQIFENATPLSLRPIGLGTPVRAVLEIRGGESARRGIRRGAKVHFALFD